MTGKIIDPLENVVNMVSCFGDTASVNKDPTLTPVTSEYEPATRERPYFDWAYICPIDERYTRKNLLAIIGDCVAANEDIRLDDIGFHGPSTGIAIGVYGYLNGAITVIASRGAHRSSRNSSLRRPTAFRERSNFTLHPDPYLNLSTSAPGSISKRSTLTLTSS